MGLVQEWLGAAPPLFTVDVGALIEGWGFRIWLVGSALGLGVLFGEVTLRKLGAQASRLEKSDVAMGGAWAIATIMMYVCVGRAG